VNKNKSGTILKHASCALDVQLLKIRLMRCYYAVKDLIII